MIKNKISTQEISYIYCVIARLSDKWSCSVIIMLGESGCMRFNEIYRSIRGISQKMLTKCLKRLEANGIVERRAYPTIPPKVEYELTDLGKEILPLLDSISEWAQLYAKDVWRGCG
ncbi:helix-turn-helix transcriptional regulator [Chryseobacterium sp. Tr-659]|uniref:winged helix-turn-helix transcriptional regulator n=1 Tax=Chryseobacterium sp. Tr-659 TaxID=2608340 RepID=UPI0014226E1D|nr:helix-turn-helix domain-containing protein [Chryseobacterium sp. Tr-659]NIF06696.1 helix-turn-helix transcriptional regulator [Chryseobacterium sp. Tr-659]